MTRKTWGFVGIIAVFAGTMPQLCGQPAAKGKKGGTPFVTYSSMIYRAAPAQLAGYEEVLRDLKLEAKQQEVIKKAIEEYQQAVPGGAKGGGFGGTTKKQQDAMNKFDEVARKALGEKFKRLDQIALQGAGLASVFTRADLKQQLGITAEQLKQAEAILAASYKEVRDEAIKGDGRFSVVGAKGAEHRTAFDANAMPKLLGLLTKEQNKQWLDLVGEQVPAATLLKARVGSTTTGFAFPDGIGKDKVSPITVTTQLAASQRAYAAGNYSEAEDFARKALALAKEPSVQRGDCLIALGSALSKLNRADDAETPLKDALAIFEKQFGPFNPRIANANSWLGYVAERKGQHDRADQLLRKALDIHEKVEGPNSAEVAQCWSHLGSVAVAQKKFAEAEKRHRTALEIREKALTKNDPLIALSLHHLAIVCRVQGKAKEAEEHALRAVEMYRQNNPDHGDLARPLRMLTDLCIQQKRWADAEKHARAWLRVAENDRPGGNNPLAEAAFKRADANGDGKLDQNEMAAALKNNLAKWDKNGDGVIDLNEYRDYTASRLGGAPAPQPSAGLALIDPLDRLATILTAAGRKDEAAAVNQRKQDLKDKLAAQKTPMPK